MIVQWPAQAVWYFPDLENCFAHLFDIVVPSTAWVVNYCGISKLFMTLKLPNNFSIPPLRPIGALLIEHVNEQTENGVPCRHSCACMLAFRLYQLIL